MYKIIVSEHILKKIILLLFAIVLSGCVSTKQKFQDDMKAQGIPPLSGSDITELFTNAKENSKNSKYEFEGLYSEDGKVKGRAWGSWGEENDLGEWKVSDDGLICVKYLGVWSHSGEKCYSVYPGKTKTDYTLVKMTGSQSKGFPTGVIPIKVTPNK